MFLEFNYKGSHIICSLKDSLKGLGFFSGSEVFGPELSKESWPSGRQYFDGFGPLTLNPKP